MDAILRQPDETVRAIAPVSRSMHSLRMRLYATLLFLDCTALLIASALEAGVRHRPPELALWLDLVLVILPIYSVIALNRGAYSIAALRSPALGVVRAFGSLMLTFGSLLLVSSMFGLEHQLPRQPMLIAVAFSFVLLAGARHVAGSAILARTGGRLETVVLIRDGVATSERTAHVIDAAAADLIPDIRNPMMLHRLAHALRGADRVVVACVPERERAWATVLKGTNMRGEVVGRDFAALGAIGLDRYENRPTLVVSTGPLSVPNRLFKRALDLAFTVPVLMLLAPVLVLTAVLIKLDSPGPVLFRQTRVGRGNALFQIYKFRSMRDDAADAAGNSSARRGDDRVTRVGRIIRRTSIDELPQLFNVLAGSMSLVGPRPHALGSLAGEQLFWEIDERYWHRHTLKPGITGLAQVRGLRGATHARDDLLRRLQADLDYIAHWSLWRDIGILLSTVRVLVHSNAY